MTTAARPDRRAIRRRDPAALATILVGQLVAYRCSTVYAPSATRLDAFVRDEVLPRLREHLDARVVLVERWDRRAGPTVRQLVDEVHRQLELEPADPDAAPLAALEHALRRADHRADRPILVVLYRLEQLLDDRRDHAEVARFVDALARMAAMPLSSLHLVLGVQEDDLGAYRDLLRGRWQLLAHDIRIRPDGKKWLLPLPLLLGFYLGSNPALIAGVTAACLGGGALVGSLVGDDGDDERQRLRTCETEVQRLRDAPPPQPPQPPQPPDPPPGEPDSTSTSTSTSTSSTSTSTSTSTTSTDDTGDPDTDGAPPPLPVPLVPKKPTLCTPTDSDSPCGHCVRTTCCGALQACKQQKWRGCVLKGQFDDVECQPDAIEKDCRKLALCALEYECKPACQQEN